MAVNLNQDKEASAAKIPEKKEEAAKPKEELKEESSFEADNARENVMLEIEKSEPAPSSPAIPLPSLADISNQQKSKKAKQKEIEKAMEENLEGIFLNLPPEKQAEFKATGEKTAAQINDLMSKGKATIKKVIDLLKKWLLIIPGVNKYFLEQEVKIKADKIMEMKND